MTGRTEAAHASPLGAGAYLCVHALGRVFALPIAHARSVFRIGALTRVPMTPPHLIGLANLRGQIVATTCLNRRLDPNAAALGAGSLAVVTEIGAETFALAVEGVGDVVEAGPEDFFAAPDPIEPRLAALCHGFLRDGERLASVLDVQDLFDFRGEAAP